MKCDKCREIKCEDCGQAIEPKGNYPGDPSIPWPPLPYSTDATGTGTIPNPGTNK